LIPTVDFGKVTKEHRMDTMISILKMLPEILAAALMILGGLKILARYTKSEADDKLLAAIEKPIRIAKGLVDKLKSAAPKPEEKEEEK